MEVQMRYNCVEMLSHYKLDKMKTYYKKKAHQAAAYIVFYDNGMKNPKEFSQVQIWWNKYKYLLTSVFSGPLGKEKRPGIFLIINKIKEKFPRQLQEIHWHAVRVNTNEASFQELTYAMMEKFI